MSDVGELLGFLPPYWGFAFVIAGGFYAGVIWFGKHHLPQDKKDTLALWLLGAYESTWSHHFCNMFDAVFGSRHLSWKCFFRSSVASVLAVLLLYFLFTEILGVMGGRAPGDLSLWHAVLFGAAINIIPDYLSLFETRWLLNRFERVQSAIGQLGVLFADTAFTGIIIWISITAFRLMSGKAPLSTVEMLALFSFYSVFFYSTFLTSVWAWVYCLSTWFMRVFSRTALGKILDVETKPVAQVALAGAVLIFFVAVALTPALKTGEQHQVSALDDMLCSVFPAEICPHLERLTKEENLALVYLSRACEGSTVQDCAIAAVKYLGGNEAKAAFLWRKNCERGHAISCGALGEMYYQGRGVVQDDAKAVSLFRQACDGGSIHACGNLGVLYRKGRGLVQDDAEAASLYRRACNGGVMHHCYNLGILYMRGRGLVQDDAEAVSLFRQACDGGHAEGCNNLGWFYQGGRSVTQDDAKAVSLFRQACDDGAVEGCSSLGWMYKNGRSVTQDDAKAVSLFQQACDGGEAAGCEQLGMMYENGRGVGQDDAKAVSIYRQACEMGLESACAVSKSNE